MTYDYACTNYIDENERDVLVYVGFVAVGTERHWSWLVTEPPRFGEDVDVANATAEASEDDAFAKADAWIKMQGFKLEPWGCPANPFPPL